MVQGALEFDAPRVVLSHYQQAILSAVEDLDGGNLAVRARAGTGKSFVLCQAVRRMPRLARILVCAFNRDIAEELKRKMPVHVDVVTTHQLGLKALRRAFPHSRLAQDRVRDLLRSEAFYPASAQAPFRSAVGKLVARAMATLARAPHEIDALIDLCGLVMDDLVPSDRRPRGGLSSEQVAELRASLVEAAGRVLVTCGEDTSRHGFDEMLWLPVVHGLSPGQWDHVVVDECQDLSAVQLELIASCLAPEGRILVCGDDRQSLYAFRGADKRAFDRLVERFSCRVLPLSITYRCPSSVVELARKVVPDYEAAPAAVPGSIIERPTLPVAELAPGDFVLSRKNAPLVRQAIRALALGKPAAIAGRDLAKDLGGILRSLVARVGDDTAKVRTWLASKYQKRIAEAVERELDTQALEDEEACLQALLDATDVPSAAIDLLDKLCNEKPGNVILFSSVHRAKGLERQRVYVLTGTFRTPLANGLPTPKRCDPIDEENVWYVSITRAQSELVLVRGEGLWRAPSATLPASALAASSSSATCVGMVIRGRGSVSATAATPRSRGLMFCSWGARSPATVFATRRQAIGFVGTATTARLRQASIGRGPPCSGAFAPVGDLTSLPTSCVGSPSASGGSSLRTSWPTWAQGLSALRSIASITTATTSQATVAGRLPASRQRTNDQPRNGAQTVKPLCAHCVKGKQNEHRPTHDARVDPIGAPERPPSPRRDLWRRWSG